MTFQLRLRNDKVIALPRPAVMGVINVSPNSFYNPCKTLDAALKTAQLMVEQGVDILDVGGEATNPNVNIDQDRPSEMEEIERICPAILAIRKRFDVLISVDTSRANVMREAVFAGADIINDQRALQDENALEAALELKTPVCLMHFFRELRQPGSSSLVELMQTVKQELIERVHICLEAGISRGRIIIDPGFGQGNYGKNCEENFYLLSQLKQIIDLGYPVLSGWSRKSMIGDTLGGRNYEDRLFGSVAADTIATYLGAHILRGHDIKATKDAVLVAKSARQLSLVSTC